MESIGDKLRTEREQKGYSIEQIARDTNIAKRFLAALEVEDFSVFPGDPYLIGFLRNYSEYLGLDPEEMVSLYRNFTIQSQPVPMEELLDRSRPKRVRIIILIVAAVAALAAGGILLFPVVFPDGIGGRRQVSDEPVTPEGTIYQLEDEPLDRRFIVDDVISVALESDEYRIGIDGVDDEVTLEVPGGTSVMRVGDERAVDLDGDNTMDVTISLTDIDTKAQPASAMLRIARFELDETASVAAATATDSTVAAGTADVGTPSLISRVIEPVVLERAEAQRPFRGSIIFRGYCLLRYVIDGEQREERYFQKGETLELDVSSELRLWISNAGNMILRVDGAELDLGNPGEVSTRIIGWSRDAESGQQVLSMLPMY